MLGHFRIHERLRQHPHALAQEAHISAQLRLARQVVDAVLVSSAVGRCSLRVTWFRSSDEDHWIASLANQSPFPKR
jgi:hypothetical protein